MTHILADEILILSFIQYIGDTFFATGECKNYFMSTTIQTTVTVSTIDTDNFIFYVTFCGYYVENTTDSVHRGPKNQQNIKVPCGSVNILQKNCTCTSKADKIVQYMPSKMF